MGKLQKAFNRLENHLQVLIEGSAEKLFPSNHIGGNLAHKLVQAMQEKIQSDPDGNQTAPNLYTLLMPPHQARALQENPQVLIAVAHSMEEYARQAGLHIHGKPMLKVVSTAADQAAEMQVVASFSPMDLGETSQFEISTSSDTPTIPLGAFLIIKGTEIIPLTRAVINIGRSDANDLVLDDLQVSREHAQLRAVRGRYIIFDLNSTGGTYVNGAQISQHELTPGDLISLADVPLIYGQEQAYTLDETQDLENFDASKKPGRDA